MKLSAPKYGSRAAVPEEARQPQEADRSINCARRVVSAREHAQGVYRFVKSPCGRVHCGDPFSQPYDCDRRQAGEYRTSIFVLAIQHHNRRSIRVVDGDKGFHLTQALHHH
jgi:hypothetical protein